MEETKSVNVMDELGKKLVTDINDVIGVKIWQTPEARLLSSGMSELVFVANIYRKIDGKHLGRCEMSFGDILSPIIPNNPRINTGENSEVVNL